MRTFRPFNKSIEPEANTWRQERNPRRMNLERWSTSLPLGFCTHEREQFLWTLQVSWSQGLYMMSSSVLAMYHIGLIGTGKLSSQHLIIIYSFVL